MAGIYYYHVVSFAARIAINTPIEFHASTIPQLCIAPHRTKKSIFWDASLAFCVLFIAETDS